MSYEIRLTTCKKRTNSTSQADDSVWESFEFVTKNASGVLNPIITLSGSDDIYRYNFAYIPDWNRYYWVTGTRLLHNGVYELSLSVDVLATYREDILNTMAFIEYGFNSDSSGVQHRLADQRQSISMVPEVATSTANIFENLIDATFGSYIVTTVGKDGSVSAYAMGKSEVNNLLSIVPSKIDNDLSAFETIDATMKYYTYNSLLQGSAISAIRGCIWIPVATSRLADVGITKRVYLGDYDTGVDAIQLGSRPTLVRETELLIPWKTDDWKRYNTQMLLYLPYYGTISVSVDQCNNVDKLAVRVSIDPIEGGMSILIMAGEYPVYTGSTIIGVSYAIGLSNVPPTNKLTGFVNMVGGGLKAGYSVIGMVKDVVGMVTGSGGTSSTNYGDIGGGIQEAAGGYMQMITPVVQCAGTLGGASALGLPLLAKLTLLYYAPLDDTQFQSIYGFPVLKIGYPVKGYCKCRAFSVATNGRVTEESMINTLLNSGVFIE